MIDRLLAFVLIVAIFLLIIEDDFHDSISLNKNQNKTDGNRKANSRKT